MEASPNSDRGPLDPEGASRRSLPCSSNDLSVFLTTPPAFPLESPTRPVQRRHRRSQRNEVHRALARDVRQLQRRRLGRALCAQTLGESSRVLSFPLESSLSEADFCACLGFVAGTCSTLPGGHYGPQRARVLLAVVGGQRRGQSDPLRASPSDLTYPHPALTLKPDTFPLPSSPYSQVHEELTHSFAATGQFAYHSWESLAMPYLTALTPASVRQASSSFTRMCREFMDPVEDERAFMEWERLKRATTV